MNRMERVFSFVFTGIGVWCMIISALDTDAYFVFVLGVFALAFGGSAWHDAETS